LALFRQKVIERENARPPGRSVSVWRAAIIGTALFAALGGAPATAMPRAGTAPSDINGLIHRVQRAPAESERRAYEGLHAAAASGAVDRISELANAGADIDARDDHGRTPLMVATYGRHYDAIAALIDLGADLGALDQQRSDVITIAGVIDDVMTLHMMIEAGAAAGLITSPYDGTALIAAAHLGHVAVVRELIRAGAPLDHVNILGWTALIDAIVLGDGGAAHTAIVRDLIAAGADVNLADRGGVTPLGLARERRYVAMVDLLEAADARE